MDHSPESVQRRFMWEKVALHCVDKIIVALKMDSLINNAIKGIILILVILVQVAEPQIREKFRKAV